MAAHAGSRSRPGPGVDHERSGNSAGSWIGDGRRFVPGFHRTAASLLFNLNPHDPETMAMAAISLAVVAAAASYLPAFRAARIAPTEALREE